jgi:hypothetical protein
MKVERGWYKEIPDVLSMSRKALILMVSIFGIAIVEPFAGQRTIIRNWRT